jgi:4-hydroxyproline epimerase
MQRIDVIDSHTEGEPTRVVIGGGPDLGAGDAATRRDRFRQHHDGFRGAIVHEPRGFDAIVGALLLPPASSEAVAQVLFFNNVGTLGMCVHGTIGVAATLAHLGRVGPGRHLLETPAGDVAFELLSDKRVAVENVRSYRHRAGVQVLTQHHGVVRGDVAYGGNWFFLIDEHGLELVTSNLDRLTEFTQDVHDSLRREGITGEQGAQIDHVELFGPPSRDDADSRNFVLCPGGEYDRSPCGTGTSAKMACLAAEGKLHEGQTWRQESILGTRFTGTTRGADDGVLPTVTGRAWITAETSFVLFEDDPFYEGIRK